MRYVRCKIPSTLARAQFLASASQHRSNVTSHLAPLLPRRSDKPHNRLSLSARLGITSPVGPALVDITDAVHNNSALPEHLSVPPALDNQRKPTQGAHTNGPHILRAPNGFDILADVDDDDFEEEPILHPDSNRQPLKASTTASPLGEHTNAASLNPFARTSTAGPSRVTLARPSSPVSKKVDSTSMIQSILGKTGMEKAHLQAKAFGNSNLTKPSGPRSSVLVPLFPRQPLSLSAQPSTVSSPPLCASTTETRDSRPENKSGHQLPGSRQYVPPRLAPQDHLFSQDADLAKIGHSTAREMAPPPWNSIKIVQQMQNVPCREAAGVVPPVADTTTIAKPGREDVIDLSHLDDDEDVKVLPRDAANVSQPVFISSDDVGLAPREPQHMAAPMEKKNNRYKNGPPTGPPGHAAFNGGVDACNAEYEAPPEAGGGGWWGAGPDFSRPQQPNISYARGGPTAGEYGVIHRSTNGSQQPWYYRLPDLVPVATLRCGVNPRDNNSVVHIDYASQFSGISKTGGGGSGRWEPKAAKATKSTKAGAAGGGATKKAVNTWRTRKGEKVFIDANGREHMGKSGYMKWKGKGKRK